MRRFQLYHHPLASYCHKVLIALYETGIEVDGTLVDLGDAEQRAAFLRVWPIGKFPVLVDRTRGVTIPESTTILEHLVLHGGAQALLPPDLAFEARAQDRFFDLYIHEPMQKIIADLFRPEGGHDPIGVEQARAVTETAYDLLDAHMNGRTFAAGDTFTIADCAAAPALFYAHLAHPMGDGRPHARAYLDRLLARPSVRRVLDEARPYFRFYPLQDRIAGTYPGLLD